MIDERDDAIKLATKVLDTHWRDPDDDLSVLARQFLREAERTTAARAEGFRAGVENCITYLFSGPPSAWRDPAVKTLQNLLPPPQESA